MKVRFQEKDAVNSTVMRFTKQDRAGFLEHLSKISTASVQRMAQEANDKEPSFLLGFGTSMSPKDTDGYYFCKTILITRGEKALESFRGAPPERPADQFAQENAIEVTASPQHFIGQNDIISSVEEYIREHLTKDNFSLRNPVFESGVCVASVREEVEAAVANQDTGMLSEQSAGNMEQSLEKVVKKDHFAYDLVQQGNFVHQNSWVFPDNVDPAKIRGYFQDVYSGLVEQMQREMQSDKSNDLVACGVGVNGTHQYTTVMITREGDEGLAMTEFRERHKKLPPYIFADVNGISPEPHNGRADQQSLAGDLLKTQLTNPLTLKDGSLVSFKIMHSAYCLPRNQEDSSQSAGLWPTVDVYSESNTLEKHSYWQLRDHIAPANSDLHCDDIVVIDTLTGLFGAQQVQKVECAGMDANEVKEMGEMGAAP